MTDDDRRHQPIDMRMPNGNSQSFRELLLEVGAQIGALRASVDHGHEDTRQLGDKLDILGDKVDEINATVQRGIGAGQMQDKVINDLVIILDGKDRKPGLIERVDKLEKNQASVRNVAIGVGIGAGFTGGGVVAGAIGLLRKFGVLMICAVIVLGAAAWAAHGAPPPGSDPNSEMAAWFRSLQNSKGEFCCSVADCRRPFAWRQDGNGYWVRATEGSAWLAVPPENILRRVNLLGDAVACIVGGQVRCFIAPSET